MKKSLSILLLILSINLFAQNNVLNKVNTIYRTLDSVYDWAYNTTLNNWNLVPIQKTKNYTYNSNNNITSYINYVWNTTNNLWENNTKVSFSYDISNNLVSYTVQTWDATLTTWENNRNQSYTYDVSGNQLSILDQTWNSASSSWVTSWDLNSTYNVNNKKNSYLMRMWGGSSWTNSSKGLNYIYDANNNLLSYEIQNWDLSGTNTWINQWKYSCTYDISNNNTYQLIKRWDISTSNWKNDNQSNYNYDANNNLISYLTQKWNTMNVWVNHWRYSYTYDANNFMISEINRPFSLSASSQGDSAYYYYHTTVGLNELKSNQKPFIVYPNPSKGTFNLSGSNIIYSIAVYNIVGTLVSNPEIRYNSQIDLSNLSKGIYFLKVSDGKQYYSEKIIIE